jgi:hypothetical protein
MNLRIEEFTHDHVFAAWDRVALALWRGQTRVSALRRGEQLFDQHASRHPGERILMLTIVEAAAPLPPIESRMELAAFLKRAADRVERSSVVFEGEGFRAASVRAVVAGISLFSRPPYPHRVFSTVGAAALFLAGGKSGSPAPHMIIRMVNETRRRAVAGVPLPYLPGMALPGKSLHPR